MRARASRRTAKGSRSWAAAANSSTGSCARSSASPATAYIANVVKCRPPGNRDPKPDEIDACRPYLQQQLDLIRPAAVVTLGRFAAQWLLETTEGITRLRGAAIRSRTACSSRRSIRRRHCEAEPSRSGRCGPTSCAKLALTDAGVTL